MIDHDVSPALRRVIAFFESLRPEDLPAIAQIYAGDARFRDPFSDVRGPAAIEAIFSAMFVRLEAPRFVITEAIEGNEQAFLAWDFRFRFRRGDAARLRASRARRCCASARTAGSSSTAITGTRPGSCTRSCRSSAR